jgi:hypothetical protein
VVGIRFYLASHQTADAAWSRVQSHFAVPQFVDYAWRTSANEVNEQTTRITKATAFSGDIMGGVCNLIVTCASGGLLFANITPSNHMMSYRTSEEKLAGIYITEKVDRKTGWRYVCLEEDARLLTGNFQDLMECAATKAEITSLVLAKLACYFGRR